MKKNELIGWTLFYLGFLAASAFALNMPETRSIHWGTLAYVLWIAAEEFIIYGIFAKRKSGFKIFADQAEALKKQSTVLMIVGNLLGLAAIAGIFIAGVTFETWHWFFGGIFVAAAGAGFLCVPMELQAAQAGEEDRKEINPVTWTEKILAAINKIDFREFTPGQIQRQLEEIELEYLVPFAQARHSFQHKYGVVGFANFFSDFATGERNMNRAWSAIVDGYPDESKSSIKKAEDSFQDCHKKLLDLEAGARG